MKLDNSGDSIWLKHYGRDGLDAANSILETENGELVLSGFTTDPPAFFPQDVLVIKTDMDGNSLSTNHITGNIFYDLNNNCIDDGGTEVGINKWMVKAVGTKTFLCSD